MTAAVALQYQQQPLLKKQQILCYSLKAYLNPSTHSALEAVTLQHNKEQNISMLLNLLVLYPLYWQVTHGTVHVKSQDQITIKEKNI